MPEYGYLLKVLWTHDSTYYWCICFIVKLRTTAALNDIIVWNVDVHDDHFFGFHWTDTVFTALHENFPEEKSHPRLLIPFSTSHELNEIARRGWACLIGTSWKVAPHLMKSLKITFFHLLDCHVCRQEYFRQPSIFPTSHLVWKETVKRMGWASEFLATDAAHKST